MGRSVGRALVVAILFAAIALVRASHSDLTETQLFTEFWWVWVPLMVLAVLIWRKVDR